MLETLVASPLWERQWRQRSKVFGAFFQCSLDLYEGRGLRGRRFATTVRDILLHGVQDAAICPEARGLCACGWVVADGRSSVSAHQWIGGLAELVDRRIGRSMGPWIGGPEGR